jgi:hypothetical protein
LVGGPPGVELHTIVEGLPSGDTGDMVPVVLPTTGVGMVPNAVPGIIVVDGIIVAVLPDMEVETVVGTVDGVGTEVAVTAGGGIATGDDAIEDDADAIGDDAIGIVELGKSVINDVAGVADSKSGAVDLAVVEVGEVAGTAGIVGVADV